MPIIMCPKCGHTTVNVYESIRVDRVFTSLDPDSAYDDFEEVYVEHTGMPLVFECQYRNCLHEWEDPEGRTNIDDLIWGDDIITETPDAR
jgi:hypothetical protein